MGKLNSYKTNWDAIDLLMLCTKYLQNSYGVSARVQTLNYFILI